MKYLLLLICFVLTLGFVYDFSYAEDVSTREGMEDNHQDYYYFMPKEERKVFKEKLKTVELGMTTEEVIKILGEPSHILTFNDSYIGFFVTGYSYRYYIIRAHEVIPNPTKDRNVTLFFTRKKKLEDIYSCFKGTLKGPNKKMWEDHNKEYNIDDPSL